MGYINHHALIVIGGGYPEAENKFRDIHAHAIELFGTLVTPIIPALVNGYMSFFVAPNGSKEYWELSDSHNVKRADLIERINSCAYEDGSNPVWHVDVSIDEDGYAEIGSHYRGTRASDAIDGGDAE